MILCFYFNFVLKFLIVFVIPDILIQKLIRIEVMGLIKTIEILMRNNRFDLCLIIKHSLFLHFYLLNEIILSNKITYLGTFSVISLWALLSL